MDTTLKPEPFDATTGEIIDTPRAVDRALVPAAATSLGGMIDMLEDMHFSAEAYEQVRELGTTIRDMALMTRSKQKGRVTITLEMESDGDAFRIEPKIAIKAPTLARPRSVAWQNDKGQFTRFPPNQGQFFGVRDAAAGARPVRTTA